MSLHLSKYSIYDLQLQVKDLFIFKKQTLDDLETE